MLSFLCLHDVMTSWRDIMTSQNSFLLYQLVDILKWWYTCISVDISVDEFRAIIVYVFAKLTPSISTCRVTRQMIRLLPCIHGCYLIRKCRCLIRKCHSISTGMMTLHYAVTSWSWRLVTISQISFHLSWLDNILQLSNMYVNLVNWHVKIEGILVLLQFHTMAWRHIVTSWRNVVTCWRQLAKAVLMICIGISLWLDYKISKCCRLMISIDVTSQHDVMTSRHHTNEK